MATKTFEDVWTNLSHGSEVSEQTRQSWASLKADTGDLERSTTIHVVKFQTTSAPSEWSLLRRVILIFTTSTLPDGTTISAAKIRLNGYAKWNDGGIPSPSINIYSANPVNPANIVATDYANLGSMPFCDTPISYANWNTAGWNEFPLNAAGIAAINKSGLTAFGVREATYDAGASTPPWEALKTVSLEFYGPIIGSADRQPRLIITYTLALPLVSTDVATDITSTSATLNGEITDVGGENCYERGFEWAETQDVPMTNSWTETGDFGIGTFSHGISGLDAGKTYYYRAKAQNSYGWGYGAVRTFRGAYVYPAEAITRVTNLIHRYSPGNFTLEMALGEVTSDFGLPQYTARPVASTPVVEEKQVITKMGTEGFQTAEQFMDVMEQGYQGRPMPESVRAKAEKTATVVEKHNREVLERLQRLAVAKQEAKDLREQVAATRERLAAVAREEEAAQKRIAELKAAGAGEPVPTFAEWLAAQAKKVVERFMWWK